MRILIAEDDKLILKTLELLLKKLDYEIICCEDGLDAMNKIQMLNPDLIIVDIMLPYISGLEILGTVKEQGSTPVIVISAMGQQTVVEEAIKLGADHFISKPFHINTLAADIQRLTSVPALS